MLTPSGKSESFPDDRVFYGMGYALVAAFLFSIMMAGAKILSSTHHVVEIVFYRNFIGVLAFLAYIPLTRRFDLLKPKNPWGIFARALFGTLSLILTFSAYHLLPMADTTVLLFTATLLTPILSFFFLKEHIGLHRWIAVLSGMCGVLLMAAPSGQVSITGVLISLAAACTHAILAILLRYLRNENPATITLYFVLLGAIIPAFAMPFIAQAPTVQEIPLFLLVGISGVVAQFSVSNAYKYAPASLIAPLNYTGLIWATGLDILIWHHIPGWSVFAGGGIIVVSKIYFIHREHLAEKRRRSSNS